MVGGLAMARNSDGLINKIDLLSKEDYDMVVSLVNRLLLERNPSDAFKEICTKYHDRKPLSMEEIDKEIQAYRNGE